MRADIAHHERRPASHGVIAPREGAVGRVVIGVTFGGLSTLHVLDLNELYFADLSVGDHCSGLTHHRVTRVVVCHTEHEACLLDRREYIQRLVEGVGDRLVADHVETVSECGVGVLTVAVVGCHDRDNVGPVGTR